MQFSFTTLQALTLLASTLASAASLQQYSGSFSNPGQIPRVHIYVPDKLANKPAVILGLHPCGGSGDGFHPQLGLAQKADQLGFVMVYPTSKNQGGMNCWDVHSAASLKRDGGGESTSVANLVKEVISKYNADPSKVYVTGFSSGAMMTNNMAAAYPDMFDAAIVTAGVPAACFTGASGSNPTSPDQSCANAQKNYTPQQWGDLARSMYPGYSGKRPRMMIVHGTSDNVLLPGNYQAELNQWSNVLGVTSAGQTPNNPVQGWTRTKFDGGNKLVGYSISGGGHSPTYNQGLVLEWFDGLAGGNSGSGPSSSSTAVSSTATPTSTATSPPTTPTSTPGGPTVNEWGQCGGIGYNGSTQCASGLRCVKSNDWYSQCQK